MPLRFTIAPVNDPLEREADQFADLMTRPAAAPMPAIPAGAAHLALQRTCASGGACGDSPHENDEQLQRRAPGAGTVAGTPRSVSSVLASSGTPLPHAIRASFEPRFQHDFGSVRIHTDAAAARSAADVQASAYTVGRNIVFGSGQFAPASTEGQHLLAHELTHVVQQRAARGPSRAVLQRQVAPGYRSSPVNPAVSSDKWREDVERAYRRAGFSQAAALVRNCRETGACSHLLTMREAWNAYEKGRIDANLGAPPESGPGNSAPNGPAVAVAGAPLLAPAARSLLRTTATSATERAALSWGVESASVLVPEAATTTAATTATVATEVAAPAAAGSTAAVATVAVPVAVGVVVVVAIVDLIGWARFQGTLERMGYFILPEPLAACILNCHTAPTFPTHPTFPDTDIFPRHDPLGPRLSPDDLETLRDWIGPSAPRTIPTPTPTPTPHPDPTPEPDRQRRRQPEVILRLPPQKATHADRYRSLIRARRLVHLANNPRMVDAQADRWDRALRPPRGQMSMFQEVWDRFEAEGVSPARRLRPNWSRATFFRFPMQVDHIVEIQVCPPGEMAIWDSFANYELLDQASNGSSGPQLAANIRAERIRLVASTGDPSWMSVDLTFTQLDVMSGAPGQRWLADEIQTGLHYDARRRLLGEIR